MKRILFSLGFVWATFQTLYGQQVPLYTQYVFDPYIINPSLVAHERRPELNLLYRQQWTGIKDGPRTVQFDFQYPVSKRVALGLNVYDDKTVLLSQTSAMVTFGYKLPVATEHVIGFGISGGVFSNRIRLSDIPDVDITDPAILNSSTNNFAFDAQFGINYSFRNLILGFSLVQLVDNRTFAEEEFQKITFSQLKNRIAFASYKFNLSPSIGLQPYFVYRFTDVDKLDYYEASALFSYKNLLDVGGGYRQNTGPVAMARVKWKNLQIGYSFDFPANYAQVSPGGTNEVQLKWNFGRVVDQLAKKQEKQEPEPEYEEEETAVAENRQEEEAAPASVQIENENPGAGQNQNTPANSFASSTQSTTVAVEPPATSNTVAASQNTENVSPPDDADMDQQPWYLILGTFEKKSNADRFMHALQRDGLDPEVKYSNATGYYYVHLPAYTTNEITVEKVMELRKDPRFKDAWFKRLN